MKGAEHVKHMSHLSDYCTDHKYQITVQITQSRSLYRSHRSVHCTDNTYLVPGIIFTNLHHLHKLFYQEETARGGGHVVVYNVKKKQRRAGAEVAALAQNAAVSTTARKMKLLSSPQFHTSVVYQVSIFTLL